MRLEAKVRVIRCCATMLTLALWWCMSASAALAWSDQHAARARALLSKFADPAGVLGKVRPPAVSVAIGRDGELVLAEGFGESVRGQWADADTRYRVGSLTKQFTAAALLRLIELGAVSGLTGKKVTIDTAASDIIEGVETWAQPEQAPITLRSLLTMTSNLPNFTRRPPPDLDPWGAIPATRLLGAIKKLKPEGWPSSFEYSNTSYFILGAIIDALKVPPGQSQPYPEVLRQLVFMPAGLSNSDLFNEMEAGSLATPHYRSRPAFRSPDWLRGSGDMVSTARDIWLWNKALLGGKIIGEAELAMMFAENARVAPTIYYGMGWYLSGLDSWRLFSHSGSVPGYTAYNAICRDEQRRTWTSVTLLMNMDGVEDIEDLAESLIRIALED